jgi:hypothetical protein
MVMRETPRRAATLFAVLTLLFAACAGGGAEDDAIDAAAQTEAAVEGEESTEEEVEEQEEDEGRGGPPLEGCPPAHALAGPRPSNARVMKGLVRPLEGKKCRIEGSINMIRLPRSERRTVIGVDLRGLNEKATYDAFIHTRACKEGAGPRYRLAGIPMGGRFRATGDFAAEEEILAQGTVGRKAISVVVYENRRPVACADLRPEE